MKAHVLVVALVAFALTGCTASALSVPTAAPTSGLPGTNTSSPIPSQTPPSTPTASSTPTQSAETGKVAPKRVFDGKCAALFTLVELGAVFAKPVTSQSADPAIALDQAGAIECDWAEKNFDFGVALVALPAGAFTQSQEKESCARETDESGPIYRCTIEQISGGIRLSGFLWLPENTTKAKAESVTTKLIALFDRKATPDQAAPVPIPALGAWKNPTDCTSLAKKVDVGAFFNHTPGLELFEGGTDAPPPAAFIELAGSPYGLYCMWGSSQQLTDAQIASGMQNNFDLEIVGGGLWSADAVAKSAGAAIVTIPGIDRAIRVPNSAGFDLYVFDGPNRLKVYSATEDPSRLYPLIKKFIAALDAMS